MRVTNELWLNPSFVASMAVDRQSYANGPGPSTLIIRMHDGAEHRIRHEPQYLGGADIYAIQQEIERALAATGEEERPCTCHPDDNPLVPCPQKFALSECERAALREERDEALRNLRIQTERVVALEQRTGTVLRAENVRLREERDRAFTAGMEEAADIILSELSPHSSIAQTLVEAIRERALGQRAGEEESND